MVVRKHSAHEIVEILLTPWTTLLLPGSVMLVPALFHNLVRVVVGTPHPLRPEMSPDDLKILGVVQQVKQVHGHSMLPLFTQPPETQEASMASALGSWPAPGLAIPCCLIALP